MWPSVPFLALCGYREPSLNDSSFPDGALNKFSCHLFPSDPLPCARPLRRSALVLMAQSVTSTYCACYVALPSGREASLPLQSVSAEVHIVDGEGLASVVTARNIQLTIDCCCL